MRTEGNLKQASTLFSVAYTHGSSVSAGEVVYPTGIMGLVLIAMTALAASVEGEYYNVGEFEFTIKTGVTISQFDKCYWDVATNTATNVFVDIATTPYLGYASRAGTAASGYIRVAINEVYDIGNRGICTKIVTGAALEALLDTATNALFAVNVGDTILNVKMVNGTATGAACVVTIGTDAAVDGTTLDVDSLLKAGDANASGPQSADDVAATYVGADLEGGLFVAVGSGNITITASTDQSASAYVGSAILEYIPA